MRAFVDRILAHYGFKLVSRGAYEDLLTERRLLKEEIHRLEVRVRACQDLHYPRTVDGIEFRAPRRAA